MQVVLETFGVFQIMTINFNFTLFSMLREPWMDEFHEYHNCDRSSSKKFSF